MARSLWKGPFVDYDILRKFKHFKTEKKRGFRIKTRSRRSVILPNFVGLSFLIYNGKQFNLVTVQEDMVGFKFGEFAPTRVRHIYKKGKK
jgi:small subunit ribosomal protein S19